MPSASLISFNKALKRASTRSLLLQFTREQILHGTPFVFTNRDSEYFEFRTRISNNFEIGFHEVFIVGSAKLGYSFVKGTLFSLDSDIDVALVNATKFEEILKVIREYDYDIVSGRLVLDQNQIDEYHSFLRYLTRGWMRPDKLPFKLQEGSLQAKWFDFFNSISYGKSVVGNYKVRAGLFKDFTYLERYYLDSIERTRAKLKV